MLTQERTETTIFPELYERQEIVPSGETRPGTEDVDDAQYEFEDDMELRRRRR